MNESVKSKETNSCFSDKVCKHRHEHDHFLDHIKHVLKEKEKKEDSGSYGRNNFNQGAGSLGHYSHKEMSIDSIKDVNFLVDQK